MSGSFPTRRRRRLVEVLLATMLVCGLSAVLLTRGHHPVTLSGGLLAAETQSR